MAPLTNLFSLTINQRKSRESHRPLPKPVALSQELQTKSSHPNPPGQIEICIQAGAVRKEAGNQSCPVAQKRSASLISEIRLGVTAWDNNHQHTMEPTKPVPFDEPELEAGNEKEFNAGGLSPPVSTALAQSCERPTLSESFYYWAISH